MKNILNQFQITLNKLTKGFKDSLSSKIVIKSDEVVIDSNIKIDFFEDV